MTNHETLALMHGLTLISAPNTEDELLLPSGERVLLSIFEAVLTLKADGHEVTVDGDVLSITPSVSSNCFQSLDAHWSDVAATLEHLAMAAHARVH